MQEKRIPSKLSSPGPYLAEITNHLDSTFMGGLEVVLIAGVANEISKKGNTFTVRYLSPFAGNTSVRYEGNNDKDYNDVQKSYGFWAVPPDIGSIVMVIFIEGDTNQGYWFGCVQDIFQNHMTPGIAASRQSAITEEQRRQYGTDYLPVAEYHTKSKKLTDTNTQRFAKPVHPFADRLVEQGLLLDTIRGVTSSSARREVPSGVFGISTPGPLDDAGKKGKIGYSGNTQAPISRLGGSTFVMDDGDKDGQNELIRLRTRTGHQILMHNSNDLIYIANSKGTAWIELTSNGKIDIYAQDSVSIHTETDFNFRADRDINIEAGRNLNIRAGKNMETNVAGYQYLKVEGDQKISVRGSRDESVNDTVKFFVGNDFNLGVTNNIVQTAGAEFNAGSVGNMKLGSNGVLHLSGASEIRGTGAAIHWNGPPAEAPVQAADAETPPDLPLFSLPNRSLAEGWVDSKFYKAENIKSIMQRVPTHEPWPQHESVNPPQFSPQATDVTLADRSASGIPPNEVTSTGGAAIPQESANTPVVSAGTCSPEFAKAINTSSAQAGIAAIKAACAKFGLTSPVAVASLLGIVGGESLWKPINEGFNYSANRLLQVFPSVFKGDRALAEKWAGNPGGQFPEFIYGYNTSKGRGLGNTQPGDGAKYIGRGYIQLTGRSNYAKYGQMTGHDLINNPELLLSPTIAAEVSVKYLLDRCKRPQTDPGYFEAACSSVGYNTADIKARKQGYYECFLAQLQSKTVGTGSGGILTDSSGTPVRTGSAQ